MVTGQKSLRSEMFRDGNEIERTNSAYLLLVSHLALSLFSSSIYDSFESLSDHTTDPRHWFVMLK